MFPSFLFHVIYSEMVDFVIVTVYLLYYLPAIEENISKVQIEKDHILETYIQRRKDQIKRASSRPSKIKTGGYVTAEDEDFVVVEKQNENMGLFQYQYDENQDEANNFNNNYDEQNYDGNDQFYTDENNGIQNENDQYEYTDNYQTYGYQYNNDK